MSTPPSTENNGNAGLAWMLLGLVALGTVGFFAVPKLMASFTKQDKQHILTHEVTKGDLLITVTEDGNIESANNVDVKCQVAGGSSILWIIEDGKEVEEGEKLVVLDSSALEEQISTQRIALEKARATKIQSEKNFSVAQISVTEYLEGTFKQLLQDADALITISEENLRSAKNSLEHSQKMFRKGYVSELDLEGAKFAVERANLELGSSQTAREVLVKFTKEKTLEDLRSQRDNAEAQMKSDAAAFDLEESRLARLEDQLTNCTIYAPQAGMVIYANERGGRFGQTSAAIEEGAAIRERQTILRLPDRDSMQVKVNVHESKVDQIRPGMGARIRVLDTEVTGQVTSIANQPEPSSFFSGNVKEYATYVRIDDSAAANTLRPGMTAEVEILVAHLEDIITLPVASVVEQRGSYVAWVDTEGTPEKRALLVGLSDDQFVEVKDGVAVSENVLLNPRTVVAEAGKVIEEEVDVSKRFGKGRPASGAAGPGSGRPRPGAGAGGPNAGQGRAPGGGKAGGGAGRRPGGGMAALDKNGDGKISKDEAPGGMKDRFDTMDSNGDGFIDKAEQAALMRKFQQQGGGGRPGGPGGGAGSPPN